uniref:Aminotransferase-like plant mobile domain-containing protein n=1 Tax=Fagus sylvatica TaxID=28930 RepID=A0A2N9EG18_FAGSY
MTMPTSWDSLASFPLSCGYELIVACSRLLLPFWDPDPLLAFPSEEVDLIPTLEEYAELLQLDSPFSETPVIPIQGPRSNRCLEKYLGLTTAVLRPEILRPEETWRKANISLDLLTKYFSRSDFPVELARDFIAGKKGWKKFRNQCLQDRLRRRQGEGVPMFCTQLLQLWFCSHLRHFYRLQTPYHFERHTVSQTVKIALPFTGNSRDWALYLLDLPLSGWSWKATIPALLFVSLAVFSTHLVLGDLDAVTFDYIPSFHWSVLRGLVTVLERELEEARAELSSLRLARASEREESAARVESLRSTLHHNSVAVANLRRDLEAQRGNVSTLRAMNEFIREQLEISEDAKDQLEETLAETREQLETEQAERTRDASEEALTSARTSMGAMRVQISVLQGDNGALHQINPGDGFFGCQGSRRLGGA